jgi:aspartate/methionine/tyrosine aminotransferase
MRRRSGYPAPAWWRAARPESGFRPTAGNRPADHAKDPRHHVAIPAPSGVAMTRAELEGIAEIARRHDLWVISDEVYASLTFDAPHLSIAALPGMAGGR